MVVRTLSTWNPYHQMPSNLYGTSVLITSLTVKDWMASDDLIQFIKIVTNFDVVSFDDIPRLIS